MNGFTPSYTLQGGDIVQTPEGLKNTIVTNKSRRPAMVEALEELDKAVATVSAATMEIYTCLGLTTSPPPEGEKAPEILMPKIPSRSADIKAKRDTLHLINQRLQEILEAVQEI